MDQDEMTFGEFLARRMKDGGLSVKRLSEATGVAPNHLENILHNNLEHMPSSPYFRGYLIRIGKALGFDGEEAWEKLKRDGLIKSAGPSDSLPGNRFIKKSLARFIWPVVVIAVVVGAYLAFELPRITGKPGLIITYPSQNPYTADSNTLTIVGVVQNADSLYLSNGDASDTEEVAIAPDGSWQKTVLLQSGLNGFRIVAKKFLGTETYIVEQIIYEQPSAATSSTTSSTKI